MNSFIENFLDKKVAGYVHDEIKDISKFRLFNMGESFIKPSKKIRKLLEKYDINKLGAYLDPTYGELREIIARKININPENILLTSGADEAISLIPKALVEPKSVSVMAVPTFYRIVESNTMFKVSNHFVFLKEKKGYAYDNEFVVDFVNEIKKRKARIAWICNPNNPTGNVISIQGIEKILKAMGDKCILVIDEVFFEFYDPTNKKSAVSLIKKYKNLIVVKSLSKSYGLAGIRVGYVVSNREIIESINHIKGVFNINILSEDVAKVALRDKGYIEKVSEKTKVERDFIFKEIKNMKKLSLLGKSQTNVFLLRHKNKDIFEELKKEKILTADFRYSIGLERQRCVRVTIQDRKSNIELLNILKKINH
jgi:histidinol-phosphate aminotransferase